MAYVKAIISPRVRKHLATPESRRAFIETYLGLRSIEGMRFEPASPQQVVIRDPKTGRTIKVK